MAAEVIGDVTFFSFKLQWEIDVFRMLATCKNVGEFVQSPNFMTSSGDVQWFLSLYPRGKTESSKDYLSLFLHVNKKIKAVCNFALLNVEGEVIVNKSTQEHVFSKRGWGCQKFLSRNSMVNPLNNILNCDKMTVACEVTVPAVREAKKANKKPSEVIDKFEDLLNDSKFSDVSLISEGKTLKVHKCIIVKSSSVFAAMFDAEMRERLENTVEIADIKYDVLLEMVRFIYSKKVNNIDALACELVVAADKYALDELKGRCEKTMTKNLNLDNVVDFLQLADRLRMDKLKEKAIEFIVKKGRSDVTDKPEFKLLPADIMYAVCRSLAAKRK